MKKSYFDVIKNMISVIRMSKSCFTIPMWQMLCMSKLSRLKNTAVISILDRLPYIRKSILRQSSIHLQDGTVIRELPLLTRCTEHNLYPFTESIGSNCVRLANETEQLFKYNLHQCESVKQIFRLLEIPAGQVTGYSAAYALTRITKMQNSVNSDYGSIDSFIRSAVMNELYDTVTKHIGVLTEEMLLSLVECYLESDSFSQQCVNSINTELEVRLVDNRFTILDLCHLATTLHNNKRGDEELVENIWIYIGTNCENIDKTNLAVLYNSLPSTRTELIPLFNSRLKRLWWELSGADIASISSCLINTKTSDRSVLSVIGKWCFSSINSLNQMQLANIITAFIHFNFLDVRFVSALERFLPSISESITPNFLAITVKYLTQQRCRSTIILDIAATVLTEKASSFSSLQLFIVLRSFGYLNYIPDNSMLFFQAAENILATRFSQFPLAHIAELLCSFCFLRRHPVNIAPQVFNPAIHTRSNDLHEGRDQGSTFRYLQLLSQCLDLEAGYQHKLHNMLYAGEHILTGRHLNTCTLVYNILEDIFGTGIVVCAPSISISYRIDFEMRCDLKHCAIKASRWRYFQMDKVSERLALLVMLPDYRCSNGRDLLGEHAMKKRLLRHIGYTVIEINDDDLRSALGPRNKERYIRSRLSRHVLLPMSPN